MIIRYTENGIMLAANWFYHFLDDKIGLNDAIKLAHDEFNFFKYHCLPKFRANGFVILDSNEKIIYRHTEKYND